MGYKHCLLLKIYFISFFQITTICRSYSSERNVFYRTSCLLFEHSLKDESRYVHEPSGIEGEAKGIFVAQIGFQW